MQVHRPGLECVLEFVDPAKGPALAGGTFGLIGQVESPDDHVLGRRHQRSAVRRAQHVVGRQHQHPCLGLGLG